MPRTLRFALLGTGFWSRFQLAGWKEVGGVECVALFNRTPEKARQLASASGLTARVYANTDELFRNEALDFVDIVTNVETHKDLVLLAASYGIPVICQKPMTESWSDAQAMVQTCQEKHVPFFIHENWRWQAPIRKLKEVLTRSDLGGIYRARLRMASAFPVFTNQPFLKSLDRFLLMDMGSHILDVARFLFGEPASLYCTTASVQKDVRGEDVATVMLSTLSGATVLCEMGFTGAPMEDDHFPQTFAFVECENGSVHLEPGYRLRIKTRRGVEIVHAPPVTFPWVDPAYAAVHASIVPCHRDLLGGLCGCHQPETTGEDNLKTMKLVFSAYDSAASNHVIHL
jgi:predicted dehydrogenase